MVDMVPTQKKGRGGGLGNKSLNATQKKVKDFFSFGEGITCGSRARFQPIHCFVEQGSH